MISTRGGEEAFETELGGYMKHKQVTACVCWDITFGLAHLYTLMGGAMGTRVILKINHLQFSEIDK